MLLDVLALLPLVARPQPTQLAWSARMVMLRPQVRLRLQLPRAAHRINLKAGVTTAAKAVVTILVPGP
eukprot:2232641-Rhodomonas_salina.4